MLLIACAATLPSCYFTELLYFTELFLYGDVTLLSYDFTELLPHWKFAFPNLRNSEVSHLNFLWRQFGLTSPSSTPLWAPGLMWILKPLQEQWKTGPAQCPGRSSMHGWVHASARSNLIKWNRVVCSSFWFSCESACELTRVDLDTFFAFAKFLWMGRWVAWIMLGFCLDACHMAMSILKLFQERWQSCQQWQDWVAPSYVSVAI